MFDRASNNYANELYEFYENERLSNPFRLKICKINFRRVGFGLCSTIKRIRCDLLREKSSEMDLKIVREGVSTYARFDHLVEYVVP